MYTIRGGLCSIKLKVLMVVPCYPIGMLGTAFWTIEYQRLKQTDGEWRPTGLGDVRATCSGCLWAHTPTELQAGIKFVRARDPCADLALLLVRLNRLLATLRKIITPHLINLTQIFTFATSPFSLSYFHLLIVRLNIARRILFILFTIQIFCLSF